MKLQAVFLFVAWGVLIHCSTHALTAGRFRRDTPQRLEVTNLPKATKMNAHISKADTPLKHNLPPLRKGEYYCGDGICKLTSKLLPKSCDGVCKYPAYLM